MKPFKNRKKKAYRERKEPLEGTIQKEIREYLEERGWYTKKTHGSEYMDGFPDLYALHKRYGQRWIEIKRPTLGKFTRAQLREFPIWTAHGVGIWVMTSIRDYKKLFDKPNWWQYVDTQNRPH